MLVKSLNIREIFATNAHKTIEVELQTLKGTVRSSVPFGASAGRYEAKMLPAEDAARKFLIVRRHFTSFEFADQKDVDIQLRTVDKTADFNEIGGNLALAISSAFLKAFALEEGMDLFEHVAKISKQTPAMPKPICNIIGGGKHAGRIDIQEFHLLPIHQNSFAESISKIAAAYLAEGNMLKKNDPTFAFTKNLESAWTTNLGLEEVLRMMASVAKANLLKMGIDFAASSLWDGKQYYVYKYANKLLSRLEQIKFVRELARNYPISYIEDPLHEDDFSGFSVITHELQNKITCGDDLYATNLERLKVGIETMATNGIIIKPNQVCTITDVIKVVEEAKKNRIVTVMSHRSGETEDNLICHLAVGLGCDYIKIGISGERTTKINEMLRIEEKLKTK